MRRVVGIAVVVVVHAAVQTLLVLGDPVPSGDAGFVARTVASALALGVAAVLVTVLATRSRRPVAVVVAVALLLVLTVAGVLIAPVVPAVVLVLGAFALPVAALGTPLTGVRATLRRRPLAAGVLALGVVVAVVLCAGVALLAGLLLAVPAVAALTWLVDGAVAGAVLASTTGFLRTAPSSG